MHTAASSWTFLLTQITICYFATLILHVSAFIGQNQGDHFNFIYSHPG